LVSRSNARLVFLLSGAALGACTEFGAAPDAGPSEASVGDASPTDASVGDTSSDAAPPPCDEPDLLGRWRLQEGSGMRAFDCTSSAHHGDLVNGTWVSGRDGGKAISFVGGDNGARIDLGNPTALRLEGAVTLSAWINVKTVPSYGRIFAKSRSTGDRGWDFFIDVDGAIEFRIATGPDAYESARKLAFPLRQWKHVAAVYDPGTAVRIYIDGREVASNTVGIPTAQRNSTQPAYIGARSDCCTLDGAMYEVRIYKRALSAGEIDGLFTAK
jgi:hypothetical protein